MSQESSAPRKITPHQPSPGDLPPWGVDDLPEPLPFNVKNLFKTIGPGAILLAASIGAGEWIMGPTMVVGSGLSILWIATVGIVLQLLFNLEAIRYTLYTGEPILTGIMRLKPGSKWWSTSYIILAGAQLGIPSLASFCATAMFGLWIGEGPGENEPRLIYLIYAVMALGVLLLLFGGTIERMLEYLSWAMIAYIFIFLIAVNLACVPFEHWVKTARGFFSFGSIPQGVNMRMLAAFAATAGSGGIGNLVITNWIRDKGMGMGGKVGAIPSAFSTSHVQLSHTGKVFPITAANMSRWKTWCRYITYDQVFLWGGGCFLGMFLNVNLASHIIPEGKNIATNAAGTFQAQYLAEQYWSGFWYLALLNGFWILFSTHLGNTDTMVRTITDSIWVASSKARKWKGGNIAKIYYIVLAILTIWGMIAVQWGTAVQLFQVIGAMAGFILGLAGFQVLIVNSRLLPKELQPPLWRKAALVACSVFYIIMTVCAFLPKPELDKGKTKTLPANSTQTDIDQGNGKK